MKSLARFVTIVLATLVAVAAIWQLRGGLWLFIMSLAVAAAVRPPINRLAARGVPSKIAVGVTYLLVLGILSLVLILFGNPLLGEIQMATNELAITYQHLQVVWAEGNPAQQFIAGQLPSLDNILHLDGEGEFGVVQTLVGATSNLIEIIGSGLLVILLSIYWTADHARFERLWLSLVPIKRRANALAIWRDMEINIGDYIRSEMAQAFLTGLALYVGYTALGLNYPALLALAGTVAWFVPIMGPFLALIPVAAIGLVQGWWVGAGAIIFTIGLFMIMEWLVEPRLFDRRRFSGLLLLLVLMICIDLFGFFGLILAPPLSVAIQIFFSHLIRRRTSVAAASSQPDLQHVRERLVSLQTAIDTEQNEPAPSVVNLVERLKAMVEKVERLTEPETEIAAEKNLPS